MPQSLCPLYVLNGMEQEKNISESNNGNICNVRLKNGELVLAVARYIILNPSATSKRISAEFSVSVQSVNGALKKIREKLGADQSIFGLNEDELESLGQSMVTRDELLRGEKSLARKGSSKIWSDIKAIMRKHIAKKMFNQDHGVGEISKIIGRKKDDTIKIIEEITGKCMDDIAKEMYAKKNSIPKIASKLGIDKKDLDQLVKLLMGYSMRDMAREMFHKNMSILEMSSVLGTSPRDIKKMLPKVIRPHISYSVALPEVRKISTIKPGNTIGPRKSYKKQTSISTNKLACWNSSRYVRDENGDFIFDQSSETGGKPADLPWKFPSSKMPIEIRGAATGVSAKSHIMEQRR